MGTLAMEMQLWLEVGNSATACLFGRHNSNAFALKHKLYAQYYLATVLHNLSQADVSIKARGQAQLPSRSKHREGLVAHQS